MLNLLIRFLAYFFIALNVFCGIEESIMMTTSYPESRGGVVVVVVVAAKKGLEFLYSVFHLFVISAVFYKCSRFLLTQLPLKALF
jgi:hypothetical protein